MAGFLRSPLSKKFQTTKFLFMSSTDRIDWKSIFSLSSMLYTILGVFSALVALQGFMIPNHFLDGGITGISILVEEVFHIPFSVCLILFNLPFIFIGYKKIGKT